MKGQNNSQEEHHKQKDLKDPEIEKPGIFKEIMSEFYNDQNKQKDEQKIEKLQEAVALDFLEECSYSIDLGNLYKLTDDGIISGTCAYNQEMEYVPLQIQIGGDTKCLYNNQNWLLQVWDSKGIKRFEEALKHHVIQWAICFNYFIFKTQKNKESNDEANYFQIRNLQDGSRTLVEDFLQDDSYKYFAYNNGKFYAANSNNIKVAAVKLTKRSGFTVKRKVNPNTVATIVLWDTEQEKKDLDAMNQENVGKTYGQKIHGLALTQEGIVSEQNQKDFIYVFLEIFGKGGNRISMNELVVDINLLPPFDDFLEEGKINEKKQFYQFTESREFLFVGQDGKQDPIKNYQFIFIKNNIHVGVALRESQRFDIYYNGNWIDDASYKDENGDKHYEVCDHFQVTYGQIVFEQRDKNNKPIYKGLKHNLYYDNAKPIKIKLLKANQFFTERIKYHVKLFSGIIVIETNIFVSHGKHISQYYLKGNKFFLRKKHFSFKSDVRFMFKILNKDLVTGQSKFSIGILLQKGQFKILQAEDNTDFNQWDEAQFEDSEHCQIPGEIISCSSDPVQYKCNLFLVNVKKLNLIEANEGEQDETRAYIFYNKTIDITSQLNSWGVKLSSNDQMVGMYEKDLIEPFFIYYQQKEQKITIFKCLFHNSDTVEWSDQVNLIDNGESQSVTIQKISQIHFSPFEIIKKEFDVKLESKNPVWIDADPKLFKINSAVIHYNYVLIFTNANCYKVQIEQDQQLVQDSITLIPELQWKTFYISDMKSIYLIMDQDRRKGVCYFDLERFLNQKQDQDKKFKDLATWLQFAQIGIISCLDYGQGIERLAYIKSYSEINLIPNLHLNQVSLIDQKHYEEYIAVRNHKDAFYAILNEKDSSNPEEPNKIVSTLITWDIVTGKKKHSNRCDHLKGNYDFTKYERFKPKNFEMQLNGLYERTLLIEKQPQIMNENQLEQFFEQESLKPIFKNQIRYVKSERDAKQIYKFQLIEILDSETIKQHYVFLHPKYTEQQAIYINNNNDKMIEWLSNDRVTFYDREDEETEKDTVQKIRWVKIRRMVNLYTIYGRPDYLINVSTDFRLFIDVNKAKKQFIIREMYTEEEVIKIPHYLMNYDKDPLETMLRVKWIGNDAIKIVNDEGMEKIFAISASTGSECKQLGYNQICNFNYEHEKNRNFYFDRKELNPVDVTERLIRKCQIYKSMTFLSSIEQVYDEIQEYEYLFTIDYQATRNITKKFFTDMSFSFITWKNIEELRDGELQVEDLDDESVKKICFSILPGGLTFLHVLYRKPKIIEKIFQKALVSVQDLKILKYSIPYLQNMKGNCPIEYCIEGDEYITINLMLKYLATQPIDHHSRHLSKHLSRFLELELSNFVYYVKNLKKQNKLISEFTRQGINEENPTVGIAILDLWSEKQKLKEILFSDQNKGSDIILYITDMVEIHEFNEVSQQFFEAMSQTEVLELFDQIQIQNLINFKWPIVKSHIILYSVLPAVCYLLSTFIYTSCQFIYHDKMVGNPLNQSNLNWIIKVTCEETILIFSFYFLSLEALQIKQDPFNYFMSFWNYMDFIPPVFQIGLTIYNYYDVLDEKGKLTEESQSINAVVMSMTTLCLWIKFLYFLRIFDATGFLVRSIIFCIQEMKYFLLILLVTSCAFADSYKVMSFANWSEDELGKKFDEKKPEQFVEGNFVKSVFYAYLIGLGDFPLDSEFGKISPLYCNILFVLNTLITTIIMLNLFIAIISNAFDKINQQGIRASYREKAGLISENEFLISTDNQNSWVEQGKYLLYVQDINQNPIEDAQEEPEEEEN